METNESLPEETTRSSVSSLKSRFEQLATREIKNGPEDRTSTTSPIVSRPTSSDRSRNISEEQLPLRKSIDDGRPVRTTSPHPPPLKPKPKPRLEAPATAPGPPKTPAAAPRQEDRRSVSLSIPRQPTITIDSPQPSTTILTGGDDIPPPTPSRPLLPPRSATVSVTTGGKAPPPLSPRPARPKLEDRPKSPDIPKTPPPPPTRSPQVNSVSPFTTPPEMRRKSPPTMKQPLQPIPVPAKLSKPNVNGMKLQPPIQMAPELPQRPTTSPEQELPKPILPPRPSEAETRKIFDRPPPPRINTALTIPSRTKIEPKHPKQSLSVSAFPPPPKRTTAAVIAPDPPSIHARSLSSNNLALSTAEINSGTDLDPDASSSSDPETQEIKQAAPSISAYPDSSQANRKPPLIPNHQFQFLANMTVKHVCVSGGHVAVSSSDLTKVYNLKKEVCTVWSYSHPHNNDGYKVTSMEFKPSRDVSSEGTSLWIGTDKGQILEFDTRSQQGPTDRRTNAHIAPVTAILRCRQSLWTLDESGKCQVWTMTDAGEINLMNTPRTFRVLPRWTCAFVAGGRLWLGQGRQISVYSPLLLNGDAFNVTQRPIAVPAGKSVGQVTCGTTLSRDADRVFVGHDDGKISIYSQRTLSCLDVIPINIYNIATLAGVGAYLWAGFRTGMIYVYDTNCTPWRVCKDWDAHHKLKITHLISDQSSLWRAGGGMVLSVADEGQIKIWDGLLMDDWLENEMQKREVEYCSFRELKIVVCTWNAGASRPSDLSRGTRPEDNFLGNVLHSVDSPDIIVFGFQELVDLEDKKMTAKTIFKGKSKSKASAVGIQDHMSHQYRVWQEKLVSSLKVAAASQDDQYVLLHSANLVGMFTCIFVRRRERPAISNLSATQGALVVRFTIDDSSLCFINCHLAAGQKHITQRNNDIATILESTALQRELNDAVRKDYFVGGGDGTMVLDHEICIFNGDMNYRIDLPRETVLNAIRRNDLDKLLEHDQLLAQRRKNPGFRLRPFSEAPITFAPTYKYNVGSDDYDTSEKRRTPAWCDRIYYRGSVGKITPLNYCRHEVYASDHRPVSGAFAANVKMVDPQRKRKVWEETANLWLSVAERAIEDAKVDYITGTYGLDENEVRDALHKKGGRVMESISLLGA